MFAFLLLFLMEIFHPHKLNFSFSPVASVALGTGSNFFQFQ